MRHLQFFTVRFVFMYFVFFLNRKLVSSMKIWNLLLFFCAGYLIVLTSVVILYQLYSITVSLFCMIKYSHEYGQNKTILYQVSDKYVKPPRTAIQPMSDCYLHFAVYTFNILRNEIQYIAEKTQNYKMNAFNSRYAHYWQSNGLWSLL